MYVFLKKIERRLVYVLSLWLEVLLFERLIIRILAPFYFYLLFVSFNALLNWATFCERTSMISHIRTAAFACER